METKIKDGATKLLQASSSSTQSMEASKGLFVSNAKIIALLREIQQLRSNESGVISTNGGDKNKQTSCQAKLAIAGLSSHTHTHTTPSTTVLCVYIDIRIPLEWQEFENTQGKVDSHAQFGVFCLFRIGNQVMDTPSLMHVDRSTMDITFKDTILL